MQISFRRRTLLAEIITLIIIVLTSRSYSVEEVSLDCGAAAGGLVNFTYYGDVFQVYMEGDHAMTCSSDHAGVTPYFIICDLNGTRCGMQRMGKLNVWMAKIRIQMEAVVTDQDKVYMAICAYDKVVKEKMVPIQVNEISPDWGQLVVDNQERYDVGLSVVGGDGAEMGVFYPASRMHLTTTLFIVDAPCPAVNFGLENVCNLAETWKKFDSLCYDLRRPPFFICNEAVDPELYIQSCRHSFCSCTTEIQTCVCNTYESYACACKENGVTLEWHPYARCPYSRMLVSSCSLQLIDAPDQPAVDHPVISQGCGDGTILSVHDKFLPTSQHVMRTTDFSLASLPKFSNLIFRCDVTICKTYTQCYMMCPAGASESQLLNGTILNKLTVFSQPLTMVDAPEIQQATGAVDPAINIGNVGQSRAGSSSAVLSSTQLLIVIGCLLFLLVLFIIITMVLLRMILRKRQREASPRPQAITRVFPTPDSSIDHFRPKARTPSPSIVGIGNGERLLYSPEVVKTFTITRPHSTAKPRRSYPPNVARRLNDSQQFMVDRALAVDRYGSES